MLKVNNEKFIELHNEFKKYMRVKSKGVPFTDFSHPFLYEDEISYKHAIYNNAKKLLYLKNWVNWLSTPGKILNAVRDASHNSGNLLEHRFGPKGNSDSPLWEIKDNMVPDFEILLYNLFLDNKSKINERFNNLAKYTDRNKLGNKWAFFSYLLFLYNPQLYFPIHSGPFDRLLKYYEIYARFSRQKIQWKKYEIILKLAELLKEKLSIYGRISAIEIQSYMWVCAYLIEDIKISKMKHKEYDFNSQLQLRVNKAKEKERIGLLGEQFIYDEERKKLFQKNLSKLANKVRLVSVDKDEVGFDILSFDEFGNEIHIEVKTTTRSLENDEGFWLSANEKRIGEKDSSWCVYRVWNIDSTPHYKNLGNIVLNEGKDWTLDISGWYVRKVNVT